MTGSTPALVRRLTVAGLLAMMMIGLAVSAASAGTSSAATGSGPLSLTASCAGWGGPAVVRYSATVPAGMSTAEVLYKVDPVGGPYTATYKPASDINHVQLGWDQVVLHGEIVIGRTSDLPPSEATVRIDGGYNGQIWNEDGHQDTVRLPSCPGNA
jgi:hypothetical protein